MRVVWYYIYFWKCCTFLSKMGSASFNTSLNTSLSSCIYSVSVGTTFWKSSLYVQRQGLLVVQNRKNKTKQTTSSGLVFYQCLDCSRIENCKSVHSACFRRIIQPAVYPCFLMPSLTDVINIAKVTFPVAHTPRHTQTPQHTSCCNLLKAHCPDCIITFNGILLTQFCACDSGRRGI